MKINNGDVLLLEDSRLVRVLSLNELEDINKDYARVQFLDKTHETYSNIKKLNIEQNLGQEPEVIGNFYSAWSMHKRLNLLGLS